MSKQDRTVRRESQKELLASETHFGIGEQTGFKMQKIEGKPGSYALVGPDLVPILIEQLRGIAQEAIAEGGGDPADWWSIQREGAVLDEKRAGAEVLNFLHYIETYLAMSARAKSAKEAHGYGKVAVEKALGLAFALHALTIVENEAGIAPWVESFAHGRRGGEAKRTKYAERNIHMARRFLEKRSGTRLSEPKLKERIGKKGNWKPDPSYHEGWLADGTGVGKPLGQTASIAAIDNGLRALGKL